MDHSHAGSACSRRASQNYKSERILNKNIGVIVVTPERSQKFAQSGHLQVYNSVALISNSEDRAVCQH